MSIKINLTQYEISIRNTLNIQTFNFKSERQTYSFEHNMLRHHRYFNHLFMEHGQNEMKLS